MNQKTYCLKFRERGAKRWWFAKPNGEATRLKIHASLYTGHEMLMRLKEETAVDEKHNPNLEFKICEV